MVRVGVSPTFSKSRPASRQSVSPESRDLAGQKCRRTAFFASGVARWSFACVHYYGNMPAGQHLPYAELDLRPLVSVEPHVVKGVVASFSMEIVSIRAAFRGIGDGMHSLARRACIVVVVGLCRAGVLMRARRASEYISSPYFCFLPSSGADVIDNGLIPRSRSHFELGASGLDRLPWPILSGPVPSAVVRRRVPRFISGHGTPRSMRRRSRRLRR